MDVDSELHCRVLRSVVTALLGAVTPNLRAVTVHYDETSLTLEAFYDLPPSEDEQEAISIAETEVIADFPEEHSISTSITNIPAPGLIPKDRMLYVYRRKEDFYYEP